VLKTERAVRRTVYLGREEDAWPATKDREGSEEDGLHIVQPQARCSPAEQEQLTIVEASQQARLEG
jgi:hypothetical protein